MTKEFLGEDALGRLIELIKTEFTKYLKTEEAQELLAEKVDKTTYKQKIYGTDGLSRPVLLSYDVIASPYLVVQRDGSGAIRTATAERDDHAVPFAQMNEALAGKLDKSTQARAVYANDANGSLIMHTVERDGISGGTIPLRRSGGRIATGTATEDIDAVPLAQLNEILDERIGSLDAALDEVLALQEFYTGETFAEIHEYAERVIAGGNA